MHRISKKLATIGTVTTLFGLSAAACGGDQPEAEIAEVSEVPLEAAPIERTCGVDGTLKTTLYGAISLDIDWSAQNLTCAGMPRPNGEGARLRFAGQTDGRDLAIIISMPGFDREGSAAEYPATVTIIEEGSARFFNSPDPGNCWTEVTSLEPLDDTGDAFAVSGGLYCVSPLAELNGDGSVTLNELTFTGLLDWTAK